MTKDNRLINKTFKSILPSQIFSAGIIYVNTILISFIVGNLMGNSYLAVFSFVNPLTIITTMFSAMILMSTQILFGAYMGKGDIDGVNKVFSSSVIASVVFGVILALICNIIPKTLASLLGAHGEMTAVTAQYIRSYSLGFALIIFLNTMISFLQIDGAKHIVTISISILIFSSVLLNILNALVFKGGMFGVGICSTLSYALAIAFGLVYFFSEKFSLKFSFKNINIKSFFEFLHKGISGAIIPFGNALKFSIINNIVFKTGGVTAVAALSVFLQSDGLLEMITNGITNTTGILGSVLVGGRNRASLRELAEITIKYNFYFNIVIYFVVAVFASFIVKLFGVNASETAYFAHVLRLCASFIIFSGLFMPVLKIYVCLGKEWFADLLEMIMGCFGVVLICVIFVRIIGLDAIWLSFVVIEALIWVVLIIHSIIKNGHFPKKPWDILCLPEDFGAEDKNCFNITMKTINDVKSVSEKIIDFCKQSGANDRRSYFCGLCIEESAANIVSHGRGKRKKDDGLIIDLRMVSEDGEIYFIMRDNGRAFNPIERLKLTNPDDPLSNIGIKIVTKIAHEITYNTLLGLNVLYVKI